MTHRVNEFNVFVQTSPDGKSFMMPPLKSMYQLSNEAGQYLRAIGYNARVHVPPPGWGAAAGIHAFVAAIQPYVFPIKLILLATKVLFDKYNRTHVSVMSRNRAERTIVVSYTAKDKAWIHSWDPANAIDRLDSMIDASHYLSNYLKNKYPNIHFSQQIVFSFQQGKASQTYCFKPNQDTDMNIARYKNLFRQTSFEKETEKNFEISKKVFIKRTDLHSSNEVDSLVKIYYFFIPSILLGEIVTRYQILKYKLGSKND